MSLFLSYTYIYDLLRHVSYFRFFFTHPNDGSNSEKGLDQEDREYVQARKLSNILCDNIQDGLRYKNKYEYFIPNIIYLLV